MRSLARLQRDARFYLSRRLNRSLAPPDRVSLNVTLRCNLKCTMCTTCYESPELTTEEIKSIIDQTAAWGVEVFNPLGGEPFMRGDIEEILSYAVRRGFYVTVTTNGTLLTEKRARAVAAIPSDRLHLNVSLDGDRSANDEIRGEGMWDRAIEGYQRIRAADAAAGNARRKILANTILHARNMTRFEAILDEQSDLGFDGVQILTLFRSSPEDSPPQSEALWFRAERIPELRRVTERLAQRAEKQGPAGYQIQNSPGELRRVPRYYTDEMAPLEAPCWAGWKELYINADGRAIMCDGKLDFLAGGWGDVRQQTLRELWRDPALRQRREVVKACTTPCIQKCYLRPESDDAADLLTDGARQVARSLQRQVRRMVPRAEVHPDVTLTLELTDVCPCDWEGCRTPATRWQDLTRAATDRPDAATWGRMRDRGYLDFGRGFMGFDVVQSVVNDLKDSSLRFGTLSLRWRGEPLIHPEAAPILRYLMAEAVGTGGVADRLRIETDGRFLTEELADVAAAGGPQEWVFDLDRGEGTGVALLEARRAPEVSMVLVCTAGMGRSVTHWRERFPTWPVQVGPRPSGSDHLWVRAQRHDHYLATREARVHLEAAATSLGIDAPPAEGRTSIPGRIATSTRTPIVSWDGKVAVCPTDVLLADAIGEITPGSLADLWRGLGRAEPPPTGAEGGPSGRVICRTCGRPESSHFD